MADLDKAIEDIESAIDDDGRCTEDTVPMDYPPCGIANPTER